jgi:cytidylate kinase
MGRVFEERSMARDVITVDGLGASGKSALAKALAQELGYGHLNSGLLYRAVGYLVRGERGDPSKSNEVMSVMGRHSLTLQRAADGNTVVIIDGHEVGTELQSPEISDAASTVARHQAVRDVLLPIQRAAFLPVGVVAEGRDMGTVVFPEARIKFFVTAPASVRAERRFRQLQGTAQQDTLENITNALVERDRRDSTSAVGTTRQAEGAVVIDNAGASLEETVRTMLTIIRERSAR